MSLQRGITQIDALIGPQARAFIYSLPDHLRDDWNREFNTFLDSPFPDYDNPPFELGPPSSEGTFGQRIGEFWFTFEFQNNEIIVVENANFLPGVNPL